MVVESSDPYVEAEILGGVLLGSLLSFVLTVLFFHSSIWSFVPMSFIFFFPSQWIRQKGDSAQGPVYKQGEERGCSSEKGNKRVL